MRGPGSARITARHLLLCALYTALTPSALAQQPAHRPGEGVASAPAAPRAGHGKVGVQASGELATYVDSDNVEVVSPSVRVSAGDELAGWRVGGRYLVDVVSAASADVVANASPRWSEVRHVVGADAEVASGDFRTGGGVSASIEPDYRSLSASLLPQLKLDDDHVTLAAGYSLGHDTIGRAGTPFDVFHRTLWRHALGGGASFVMNASTVLWLGGDLILERGDQSKPYRYVPLFDAATAAGLPRGASQELVNQRRLQERPLENLPRERNRYALTARLMNRSSWATLRVEERLYADSWSQIGSTTDLRYAMDVSRRFTVAPSLRVHLQNGTSFWQRGVIAPDAGGGQLVVPSIRTGDRELGPLCITTFGSDFRWALTSAESRMPVSLLLRVALSHTEFFDAIYLSRRQALFTALGFEGRLD